MKIKLAIISLLLAAFLVACQTEDKAGERNSQNDRISGQGEFVAALDFGETNTVTYHDGEQISVHDEYVPVFVNGQLVKYSGMMHEGEFLVQIEILGELLGTAFKNENGIQSVETDQHTIFIHEDEKIVEVNGNSASLIMEHIQDTTYIDMDGIIPYLNWAASYYYKDTDEDHPSLIRHNHAIYLDEPITEEYIETEDAGLQLAQALASEALENYKVSLRESLEESGEDPARMDSSLDLIHENIQSMLYVGAVSKYYIYDMGVYRVFVDRTNGDIYFNYETGRATYTVLVDVNDPHVFTPLYMIG